MDSVSVCEQRSNVDIDPPAAVARGAYGDEERPDRRGPDGAQLGARDAACVRSRAIERVVDRGGAEAQSGEALERDRVGDVDSADGQGPCAQLAPTQPGHAAFVAERGERVGRCGARRVRRLGDRRGV